MRYFPSLDKQRVEKVETCQQKLFHRGPNASDTNILKRAYTYKSKVLNIQEEKKMSNENVDANLPDEGDDENVTISSVCLARLQIGALSILRS